MIIPLMTLYRWSSIRSDSGNVVYRKTALKKDGRPGKSGAVTKTAYMAHKRRAGLAPAGKRGRPRMATAELKRPRRKPGVKGGKRGRPRMATAELKNPRRKPGVKGGPRGRPRKPTAELKYPRRSRAGSRQRRASSRRRSPGSHPGLMSY